MLILEILAVESQTSDTRPPGPPFRLRRALAGYADFLSKESGVKVDITQDYQQWIYSAAALTSVGAVSTEWTTAACRRRATEFSSDLKEAVVELPGIALVQEAREFGGTFFASGFSVHQPSHDPPNVNVRLDRSTTRNLL